MGVRMSHRHLTAMSLSLSLTSRALLREDQLEAGDKGALRSKLELYVPTARTDIEETFATNKNTLPYVTRNGRRSRGMTRHRGASREIARDRVKSRKIAKNRTRISV